jgi:hypothetical protein
VFHLHRLRNNTNFTIRAVICVVTEFSLKPAKGLLTDVANTRSPLHSDLHFLACVTFIWSVRSRNVTGFRFKLRVKEVERRGHLVTRLDARYVPN